MKSIEKSEAIDLLEFEDVVIVDKDGIVVFDDLANLSLFDLRPDEIIGRKVTTLYNNLSDDNSIFMKVLKDGNPVLNAKQDLVTKENNHIHQVSSTFPIMSNDQIVGAVEFSKFLYKTNSMHAIKKHSAHKVLRKNNTIYTVDDIVTQNKKMLRIKERILKVAKTYSTVMINGKTGTGKELIAQAIHNYSDRCHKPFISQNCAAIPGTLLESILFGTKKGSFTGAEDSKGLLELADGGTLFLDEINSMDMSIQVKILKAIEEKTIRRVGGSKNISLDVRIISALNEDPENAIREGKLREDLYYRLSTVVFNLPRLSEREEDLKLLTDHFIKMYNNSMNIQIKEIKPEVLEAFKKYSWPGNIRELRNVIESFYNSVNESGIISIDDVSDKIKVGTKRKKEEVFEEDFISLKYALEEYEKSLILRELETAKGIAAKAARNLKVSKQTLKYKMDKYQINI